MLKLEDLPIREREVFIQCCRALTYDSCIYMALAGYKYVEQTLMGAEESPVITDYLKSLGLRPGKRGVHGVVNGFDVLTDFGYYDDFEDSLHDSLCDRETAKFVWDSMKAGKLIMSEEEYINTNNYKRYLAWGKHPENILLSFLYLNPEGYISMSDAEFEDSISVLSSMTFSGIAEHKITGSMVDRLKVRMREVRNLLRNTEVKDEAFKDNMTSKYGLFEETLTVEVL